MLKRYFKNWWLLGCKVYYCFIVFEDNNKLIVFVKNI